jgi:hypothetical protein
MVYRTAGNQTYAGALYNSQNLLGIGRRVSEQLGN